MDAQGAVPGARSWLSLTSGCCCHRLVVVLVVADLPARRCVLLTRLLLPPCLQDDEGQVAAASLEAKLSAMQCQLDRLEALLVQATAAQQQQAQAADVPAASTASMSRAEA